MEMHARLSGTGRMHGKISMLMSSQVGMIALDNF